MNSALRDLYQIEFEQHSKVLEKGFQHLSSGTSTTELFNELMRAAHSLKGAARLVGKSEVAETAHELEATLKELPSGTNPKESLSNVHKLLLKLGLKDDALRGDLSIAQNEASPHSLLHVTPDQISELIHLASDLAVTARRLYGVLETDRKQNDSALNRHEGDIERIYALAHTLQASTHELRLVRLSEITKSLEQIVIATAQATKKSVRMQVLNSASLVDRQLIPILEPCLIQIIKNCVDHGIEFAELRSAREKPPVGRITISGQQRGAHLQIVVSDDGAGIDYDRIRTKVVQLGHLSATDAARLTSAELVEFLFLPGFSTKDEVSEFSGRGIGLDIVRSRLEEIGGSISLESTPGFSSTFTLSIPSQIASFRSLLCAVGQAKLAIPLAYVERVLAENEATFVDLEGVAHVSLDGSEVPLIEGRDLYVRQSENAYVGERALLILNSAGKRKVLRVDRLVGEEETVLKRLDARFQKQAKILGSTIGRDNALIAIINVEALLAAPHMVRRQRGAQGDSHEQTTTTARILVVDDSLTVRELERRILISAGYTCEAAVDGVDALNILREKSFDLIVTDIDMPRMNGFDLITELRRGSITGCEQVPVIVVSYKEREADRQQAQKLGANEFLSKGSFKDQSFIVSVKEQLKKHKGAAA